MATINKSDDLGWQSKLNPDKIKWMDEHAVIHEDITVLDLGAGRGWYSKYLADKGCIVTSLDMNPLFTDQGITIKKANLEEKLNLPSNHFDLVIAWDIIEHIKNEDQLFQEISRVLKRGGALLVSVPHADDSRISNRYLTYSHFKDKTHFREYTPSELEKKAALFDFNKLSIRLNGGEPYPYIITNFINFGIFKLLMKVQIKLMTLLGIIKLESCHGDVFGAFVKK